MTNDPLGFQNVARLHINRVVVQERIIKKKFYRNGLYFECTECGNCCTDASGYVELSAEEAAKIAALLGVAENEFLEKFVEAPDKENAFHLKSHPNGDCIFLSQDRCSVYPARPLQCRTFPFWPENLKSGHRWKMTAAVCPGINRGRLYSEAEIEDIVELIWNSPGQRPGK